MIVPEAISHPAKFSNRLIRRIYEHMLKEGWLRPGDMVIDPFGGVALGALDAMRMGLAWRGVELEPRFVDLGNQNILFWNKRFSRLPGWSGDALLLQGWLLSYILDPAKQPDALKNFLAALLAFFIKPPTVPPVAPPTTP